MINLRERPRIAAGILIAGLVVLAWTNRFVQDDAFIAFRYARNLVEGRGLVWNPGERVEGYTNFLWTALVAAGMRLGADPVVFTQTLGLGLFAVSLCLLWLLSLESGLGSAASLTVVLLSGTNFTFSAYATGGLETPLVTALFLAGCLAAVRVMAGRLERERGLLMLSVILAAGVLTRMDTVLLLAVPAVSALAAGPPRGPVTDRQTFGDIARLTILPALLVGGWLAWKYSYYGDILPRAFYLKAVNASSIDHGLRYFYEFIVSYNLAPFLFFAIFFFGPIFRREHRAELMMAASVSIWFIYLLKVGGDFMEFRFMAPAIPVMMVLLVWMLFRWTSKAWLRTAGVALVLAGSFHHAATFAYDREAGVEPVAMLGAHLDSPGENWIGIGKTLGGMFRPEDGVVIATTAAGAIPFYSRLRSVDMLGLNEPGPAGAEWSDQGGQAGDAGEIRQAGDGDDRTRGVLVSTIPGHRRVLPFEYLNLRGVHLVISHPVVTRVGETPAVLPLLPVSGPPHLRGQLLYVPIGGGYQVVMLYIRPHPAIDSMIALRGWPTRGIAF